ncbi:hypothetical protein LCGC14_1381730 [marine sediment metagenome]|uniref:Uncharacterized protein n=1 Tax=marine sediment metagenome TaxID=412755 RepID=A0A0F9K2X3_9ZZZZ
MVNIHVCKDPKTNINHDCSNIIIAKMQHGIWELRVYSGFPIACTLYIFFCPFCGEKL